MYRVCSLLFALATGWWLASFPAASFAAGESCLCKPTAPGAQDSPPATPVPPAAPPVGGTDGKDRILTNPKPKSVRFVWLIPSDAQYDKAVEDALVNAATEMQGFYKRQAGKGFTLNEPVLEIVYGKMTRAQYSAPTGNGDPQSYFMDNGKEDLKGRLDVSDDYRWVVFVSVEVEGGLGGLGGLPSAFMPQGSIDGVMKRESLAFEVLAHEMGHAFGLPHNEDAEYGPEPTALMFGGADPAKPKIPYPNAIFLEEEKKILVDSGFFTQ
jgi:hypothetical protein